MKNLQLINDDYLGYVNRLRHACRGIIVNDGKVLLSYESKNDKYMIPGGGVEGDESYAECCERELLEETGFGGGSWSLMGRYAPNPNSMSNWCYSFLAEGVTKTQEPHQEPTENILVHQVSKEELLTMMKSGKIVFFPI